MHKREMQKMKYKSKDEAIKDHVDNYRSDGVKKRKGMPDQRDFFRFQFFIQSVPEHSHVLDVGCNSGTIGRFLIAQNNCHVLGIDVVPELVKKAKRNGTFAIVGEAENINMPDNYIDVVTCGEVLEHLYDPEIAIKEAHRVLKPNGIYLVTVPHPDIANVNKLGDYHQQDFKYNQLYELFTKYFNKNNVHFWNISWSKSYCEEIAKTKEEANILLKTPQWLGIHAKKD